jgi:hypothetical protein
VHQGGTVLIGLHETTAVFDIDNVRGDNGIMLIDTRLGIGGIGQSVLNLSLRTGSGQHYHD